MKSVGRLLIAGVALATISFTPPSAADESVVENAPPTLDGVAEARVDEQTGAMQTEVAISMPAARGLPQPRLALQYNSSSRDREAGYGWGLYLPVIERKPLSGWPKSNTDGSPVGDERYTFSGKPLVRICVVGPSCPNEPSTSGHPGWANGWTYYRLQVEGVFARFYRSDDRRSWRVQLKGGERLDFGAPRGDDPHYNGFSDNVEFDSMTTGAPPGVMRWRLSRQLDAAHPKNFIVYKWQSASQGGGLLYLKDIFYTPPVDTPAPALDDFAHHVQLDWAPQPYPTFGYLHPDKAALNVRLTRVAVASKSWAGQGARELVRQYVLSYYDDRTASQGSWADKSPLWGHSFLKTVQVFGRCQSALPESEGVIPFSLACAALLPTEFEYSDGQVLTQTAYRSSILDGPPNAEQQNKVFTYLPSTALVDFNRDGLPDVVQGWDGPCDTLQVFPGVSSCIREVYTYIGNGATEPGGFEGELWCHCKDMTEAHQNRKLRSARPIVGYLNKGISLLGAGNPQLQYQCMDAGGTSYGIDLTNGFQHPPDGRVRATFLSDQGSSVVGKFGAATVLWQNDFLYPVLARPISHPSYPAGSEPPNFALGGCSMTTEFDKNQFYPRWSWEINDPGDWMKHAPTPTPTANDWAREPAWFVDVDGDGFPDKLVEDSPSFDVAPDLKRARVAYTRHTTSAEGPPQSQPNWNGPYVTVIPSAAANSIVPARTRRHPSSRVSYADVNGDGIADLITSSFLEDFGLPRIRPGDGRGGFGCLTQWQPPGMPCQSSSSAPAYYPADFSNGPTPMSVAQFDPVYPAAGGRPLYFHDVTGDGLADIVVHKDGHVYVWINEDGQHFACFGSDPTDPCRAGSLSPPPPVPNVDGERVSFADMDGNGVDDVVVLLKSGLYVVPVFNRPVTALAPRPGLLVRIRNLGATTTIQYNTLAEFSAAYADIGRPWTHKAPVTANLVSAIHTQDVHTFQGASMPEPFRVDRTVRYRYVDPAYDRWKRQLVGFRKVATQVAGEDAITETTYWYGPCENDGVASRTMTGTAPPPLCGHGSDDEDFGGASAPTFRGLVGRTVRVDHYIPGQSQRPQRHLWSRYTRYSPIRTLLAPAGERKVTFVQPTRIETHHYDTNLAVVQGATETVAAGGDVIEHPPTQAGERIVIQEMEVDSNGSLMYVRDLGDQLGGDRAALHEWWATTDGSVRGAHCDSNWRCSSPRQVTQLQDASGAWETTSASVKTDLYPNGDVQKVSTLTNRPQFSTPLQRGNNFGPYSGGPSMAYNWKVQAEYHYDADSGIVDELRGPGESEPATRSCTRLVLDSRYRQFPRTVIQFKDGCDSPASLQSELAFNRAYGVLVGVTAPDGGTTMTELDAFGRKLRVYVPNPADSNGTLLSTEINHVAQSPLSYVAIKRYTGPGAFVESVSLFNAVGEPVLTFSTGDNGAWIVDGWTERDDSGRPRLVRRPFSSTKHPIGVAGAATAVAPPTGNGWFATSRDRFGRISAVNENGMTIREQTYLPLSVTVRDAMQLPGAPNDGASTTMSLSGRGLLKKVVQRRATGPFSSEGDITTSTTYDGLGHPLVITRSNSSMVVPGYTRTMVWDAFGKLLENNEPNTARNGKSWRYAYDDANRLAGTSDARGCGKDIYYDGLGRVTGEDYSPCTQAHHAYSSVVGPGNGHEVEYVYDDYEEGQVSPDPEFTDEPGAAAGRLVAVRDRGAHTRFNYDNHGRVRRVSRRIARPNSESAGSYTDTWYAARTDYDLGGRVTRKTTGFDPEIFGVNGTSEERYSYSARGLPYSIDTSFGLLIESMYYGADGLISQIKYGDDAHTQALYMYNARRQLETYDVMRSPNPLWTTNQLPRYPKPSWLTTQTQLARFRFLYDAVGNPKLIEDNSDPGQYVNADMLPMKSRTIGYDDLYRVVQVDYRYPSSSGNAGFRSPYVPEINAGDTRPVPSQNLTSRIREHSFAYDYLGNVAFSRDDLYARYDRSLGDIVHGSAHPNQIESAPGLSATHDEAGNLIELKIERQGGQCVQAGRSLCAQWFVYDWGEVGQLARARRWDFQTTLPVLSSGTPPSGAPAWDLHYAYSMGNRVLKSAKPAVGPERHTLDVFDSLRLKDTEFVISGVRATTISSAMRSTASSRAEWRAPSGMSLAPCRESQVVIQFICISSLGIILGHRRRLSITLQANWLNARRIKPTAHWRVILGPIVGSMRLSRASLLEKRRILRLG